MSEIICAESMKMSANKSDDTSQIKARKKHRKQQDNHASMLESIAHDKSDVKDDLYLSLHANTRNNNTKMIAYSKNAISSINATKNQKKYHDNHGTMLDCIVHDERDMTDDMSADMM